MTFACDICGGEFCYRYTVKRHKKLKHQEEEPKEQEEPHRTEDIADDVWLKIMFALLLTILKSKLNLRKVLPEQS